MLTDDGLFSLPFLSHTLDEEITQTGCVGGHVTYRARGVHLCYVHAVMVSVHFQAHLAAVHIL